MYGSYMVGLARGPSSSYRKGRGSGKACACFVLAHNYSYYTERDVRTNSNIYVGVACSCLMCDWS